ncbi:hypothetical protein GJ496_001532 [Pomphorhynchus laevis]|nr:hypothetical protein GJ496_001532 [Pomphorhynchus laevis]
MSSDSQSVKAESDSEQQHCKREGKIFVGGLTWDTTVDDVKAYFRRFGDITDATIIKDPISGRSRGFGFIVFEEESTMKKVFNTDSHYINGKKVDTKNAFRRNTEPSCRKIFVGGVDPLLPENEIREYFSNYGQIEEIDFPWDKEKNQRRAFCFVAFSSSDVIDEILKQSKHKLGDRMVDVKKATPKQENTPNLNSTNVALSLITQALNMSSNNSNLNPNNNLLASLLGSQQTPLANNSLNSLNANSILPALAGLGYPLQTANQQPNTLVSGSNPYFALAAAAAAAGIYPPSSPSVDITNWYSNIALAAAAAASQDGHSVVPSMLHQNSYRDIQIPQHHYHQQHGVSNNGSKVSMMGAGHAAAASSGSTVPASGTAGSGVYRKQSRSANDLSPNTSAVVGATGVHRNTI